MLKPALVYFGIAFAAGFVLGVGRVLALEPRVGEVVAVLIECPIILFISFRAARWTLRHYAPAAELKQRLAIGLLAFVLLMGAELGLTTARGVGLREYLGNRAEPAGVIGLASQFVFALIPMFIRPRLDGTFQSPLPPSESG